MSVQLVMKKRHTLTNYTHRETPHTHTHTHTHTHASKHKPHTQTYISTHHTHTKNTKHTHAQCREQDTPSSGDVRWLSPQTEHAKLSREEGGGHSPSTHPIITIPKRPQGPQRVATRTPSPQPSPTQPTPTRHHTLSGLASLRVCTAFWDP